MAAGDISDNMVSEIGLRCSDTDRKKFTESYRFEILNNNQVRLAQLLHNSYLTELQDIATDVDISTGSYALSSLNSGNGVLRGINGIIQVQVDPGGAGADVYANEIAVENLKDTEETWLAPDDTNPLYYKFAGSITFLMDTLASSTANIFYLKYPTTMTTDVDPVLNVDLHHLIVDLSEADCWGKAGKFDRKQSVLDTAMKEIETLNARFDPPQRLGPRETT